MTSVRDTLLGWIDRDPEQLVAFLSKFVSIPSPNPPGDTCAAAGFLHDYIKHRGAPVEYRTAKPNEWVDVDEYLHIVRTHAIAAATYLTEGVAN